jgi:luciferase family oxidoreductase group 1
MPSATHVPLSVLDLAFLSQGSDSVHALANTTALARHADALGFTRFWVAEHHNMPNIASTTPPVLIAHLAAVTERIRIGSGGVMLPNHPALVVSEQFAMLEALHPGRIDLGIGRAPGTDPTTAAALRRSPSGLDGQGFPLHVLDLMGLLGDPRTATGLWQRFRATPQQRSSPAVILLGSSGYSAQLAGKLGLPFAYAHHFDISGVEASLALYRQSFTPSAVLDEPYSIVTASVLAADSDAEAARLAGPGLLMRLSAASSRFEPLLDPDQAAAHPDLELARQARPHLITGGPETVRQRLEQLVAQTEADEIMVDTETFGLPERLRSLELLAGCWGLRPQPDRELAAQRG